jgi:hypothetical protein
MRNHPDLWVEIRTELFGQLRAAGLFFTWAVFMTSFMLLIVWASVSNSELESKLTTPGFAENGPLRVPPVVSASVSTPRIALVKNELVSR